ncbi:hypothetical protein Phou_015440 [Phytohabitans houttuyneae]|uniref:Uncharacterized protein n=1 Tax=Phytohabitans houttuyneae TaxID=1076126 RepID=A0A6V8K111_9ACTN|nr:hypothetical protein Phou_015440 [Phytohabitans houttuyneae]
MTLYAVLRRLQHLLAYLIGTCPTCRTRFPHKNGTTAEDHDKALLATNRDLLTSLHDQLVQRYLVATGQRHGIYLVYWVSPDQRPSGSPKTHGDKDELLKHLRSLSAEVAPQYDIHPYVLDVSWPSLDQ